MKTEQMNSFTARITQASQTGLVVITYEIIITYIENAKASFTKNDFMQFQSEIKEAQKFLKDLQYNLNMELEISRNLMSLYIFCNKQLIEAMIKSTVGPLESVEKIINNLSTAFNEILKEDHSMPAMRNSEVVYAGLTYGKHALNETRMNSVNRGYKV